VRLIETTQTTNSAALVEESSESRAWGEIEQVCLRQLPFLGPTTLPAFNKLQCSIRQGKHKLKSRRDQQRQLETIVITQAQQQRNYSQVELQHTSQSARLESSIQVSTHKNWKCNYFFLSYEIMIQCCSGGCNAEVIVSKATSATEIKN